LPLGDLGLEFILGIGAALFAANAWVLLRPVIARRRGNSGKRVPRPTSTTRVVMYMLVGGIMTVWALVTLAARR
jgi:hypothetical protein